MPQMPLRGCAPVMVNQTGNQIKTESQGETKIESQKHTYFKKVVSRPQKVIRTSMKIGTTVDLSQIFQFFATFW